MKMVRVVSRLLTGSAFAVLGFDALQTPGGRVDQAASTLGVLRNVVPLPENDELLVRANGAAQTAAGVALALGRFPRLSALTLAGSLIPTTYAGHAFWKIDDPAQSKAQRVQFLKNAAMLGGLLLLSIDGD
ncbi:DoxX family protein [Leekyejoonella antrihumi]|uniref:DoxX family protein n=1 Tax=Leekyejoonella antrihumi TaxID=1660198 RepID=A0A563DUH5_9MICO|nr:DoxX family protein [Leekyejoonella antrihumi]TWP33908.1 DoxX family protein [Leekyejoonella antrihumi]